MNKIISIYFFNIIKILKNIVKEKYKIRTLGQRFTYDLIAMPSFYPSQ
jgi:hypothetical protein